MKESYDKTARTHSFEIGSLVMLWNPYKKRGISGCFQPKWSGPWSITEFSGDSNCKIQNVKTGEIKNVHCNQLKAVVARWITEPYENDDNRNLGVCQENERFNDYLEDFIDDEVQELNQMIPYNMEFNEQLEGLDFRWAQC